jgi:MSHA biogenesis protein MshL
MNPLPRLLVTAIALSGLMLGCQTSPQKAKPLPAIEATLKAAQAQAVRRPIAPPQQISAALLPPIELKLGADKPLRSQDRRFDVNVNQAPAREFFMSLVDGTDYNMVIHPDVKGEVSLALKNVTIPEVMQILRDVYGFEFQRTSAGYNVMPVRLQSRIFQVNYLNVRRNGNSQMHVSSGQISQASDDGASDSGGESNNTAVAASEVTTESSSDFWSELRTSLQTIVGTGQGRSVMVAPQSGIVVVRGMPAELREVENFLRTTQASLHRQVILEAKIIEVSLNDDHQTGINWGKVAGLPNGGRATFGQTGGGTVFGSDGLTGIQGSSGNLNPKSLAPIDGLAASAFGGVFSLAVATNSFAAFIELLESQGTVQVLSSPRVATVNNQKAVIKVGQDEFFVTDVSTTTVTGNATASTPNVTLTPFFSGIALDVTPQIDAGGSVTLHIHPSVSEVFDQTKTFTIDDKAQTLPLAQSRVRESDSIVRAQNGQIVVIGGLMQESSTDKYASPPGIGRAPVLGGLLSHKQQSASKSELVILLKPLVVDSPEAWGAAVAQTRGFIDGLMHDRNQGYPSAGDSNPVGEDRPGGRY